MTWKRHFFTWKLFLIIHWANSAVEFEKKKEVCILYGFNSKVYGRGFALKELTILWGVKACIYKLNSNTYEN